MLMFQFCVVNGKIEWNWLKASKNNKNKENQRKTENSRFSLHNYKMDIAIQQKGNQMWVHVAYQINEIVIFLFVSCF